MNKNLKRALNTTAAVSMSLAMVLGAVAPVSAQIANKDEWNFNAVDASTKFGKKVVESLGDVTAIALDDVVYVDGAVASGTNSLTLEELLTKATIKTATSADVLSDENVAVALKYSIDFGGNYTDEEKDAVKHLNGVIAGVADLLAAEATLKTYYDGGKELSDKYDGTHTYLNLYNEVNDLLSYKGNVKYDDQDKLDNIETYFEALKEDVADHKEDNLSDDAEKFAEVLAEQPVAGTIVDELINGDEIVKYTNLSSVENFIKKVTKDSFKLTHTDKKGNKTEVKYGDVKEEDAVVDMIEALENVASEMKEAKELLDDAKDVTKAFKKLDFTVLVNAINGYKKDGTTKFADEDEQLDAIDDAIADFRAADIEALKAYVDTVVSEFWTVAVDQRTSGSYRVKEVNAGLGRYYAFKEVATNNLHKLMTTLVDRDEEETYYDVLVADAASVDELLKAVTTDIEGMTMNTVMTNQQAAKIIAARKALTKIDAGRNDDKAKDTSIYTNDLTRAERAEVDANREMIEVLYVKLLLNGEVTTIGWVETAKGWEYYDNNGKRVYEGWAPGNGYWSFMKNGYSVSNEWCAAKEGWYYMGADGKMVTGKVMINGVEEDFGTDGIWVRK